MKIKYEDRKGVVFDPEWQEWMVFRPNRQGGVYCVGAYKTKAEADRAYEMATERDKKQWDDFLKRGAKDLGGETYSETARPQPTEKRQSIFDELRFGWFGWFLIVVIAGKLLKLVLVE